MFEIPELYSSLRASDDLLAKALAIPEPAHIRRIEDTLRELFVRQWRRQGRLFVARAAAVVRSHGALNNGAVWTIRSLAEALLGREWAKAVEAAVREDVDTIYRLGREEAVAAARQRRRQRVQKAPTGTLTPDFELPDQRAIEALVGQQLFWIGELYNRNLSELLARVIREIILERGYGREEAADALEKELAIALGKVEAPSGWRGSMEAYLEGLATSIATTARTAGKVRTLQKLHITRYIISNPIDERTCPVCLEMDGKVFEVKDAVDQQERVFAAQNPDDVRRISPWLKPHQIRALGGKSGPVRGFVNAGFMQPPFHSACRCVLDIADEDELDVEPAGEA